MVQHRKPGWALSPDVCALCRRASETCVQLFLHGDFAGDIWRKLFSFMGDCLVKLITMLQILHGQYVGLGKDKENKVLYRCAIMAASWCIWLEGNSCLISVISNHLSMFGAVLCIWHLYGLRWLGVLRGLLLQIFRGTGGKGPKRVGALHVTCQLFKIYFKLGTVHLCRSVIRSIETARIFDFEEFPTRDKVTYMYYTGRLEVFNENFPAADQKLSYALTLCHPRHEANIRMILKYLIPVKLSIGILPGEALLKKFNLLEYRDVVLALRMGDLRLLRSALQEHEDRFLRSGVYLVLEKLELVVYRRLIKKIYIIQKHKDPSKAHQVKLDVIVKALKWLQIDMDVDEVECIVAILIYKNLIKGYFAHKSKVVVLSKQDPFPTLNDKPVSS